MPEEAEKPKKTKKKRNVRASITDSALMERLQSILINAAEGRRSVSDDQNYFELTSIARRRSLPLPRFVQTHPSVDSFAAYVRGVEGKPARAAMVRADFEAYLNEPPDEAAYESDKSTDSSEWTGVPTRVSRLKAMRALLPLAQVGVESMIATLSEPNPNGAPLLDSREEAIANLRKLHRALGELLAMVDNEQFDDELGQSLAAEAARYAKRAARALRDDPMPYLSSALLLGLFEACGMPGIAGYLAGVALNVRKHGEGKN